MTRRTPTELLSKKKLAGRLGVSEPTVDRQRDEGLPYLNVGSRVLFDWHEVLDWLRSRNKAATT